MTPTATRTLVVDPVTRIEGHARVVLDVDEQGSVLEAHLVVNELRGFERILVGVEAHRMPQITARVCGVCPTAHHLAAVKALERAAGVEPPPAARRLRELLLAGHYIHSHALSLFVLQGPDVALGIDSDAAARNVVGLVAAAPEVAKKALRCRTLGQKINEAVGGRGVHPVTAVAGGMTAGLTPEELRQVQAWAGESVALAAELIEVLETLLERQLEGHPHIRDDWNLPAWSVGTVENGRLSLYEGRLRMQDPTGAEAEEFDVFDYDRRLVESVVDWSYMKPVRLRRPEGDAVYRVGPLARLNAAGSVATPLAQAKLESLQRRYGRPAHRTVAQIHARMVEFLFAAERARQLAAEAESGGELRVPARPAGARGVGHVEAPRGVLIHDYEIDEAGIVRRANLLVATQQNSALINESIRQAAARPGADDQRTLDAVEFAIRCYDPCLSCATHALGQMPLEVVTRRDGRLLRRLRRPS